MLKWTCVWLAVFAGAAFVAESLPASSVLVLDNEYVRVIRRTGGAVLDCVSPAPVVLVRLGGEGANSSTNSNDKISAEYVDPGEKYTCHSSRSATTYEIALKVEAPRSKFTDDPVKLDAKHNEVLLENERVRVERIHFAAGESGPMVDKRPRVIVVLTDSRATVTLPDGHSEPRNVKAGTVYFGNAGRQATKNIGTTPLENIVVELKSK